MRIAQIAPLYESVPPKNYGGTERVVSYLTEELVRTGHDVTLFASGDSNTTAELVPITKRSLRTDSECVDALAHHVLLVELAHQRAAEFDVMHFHINYLHYPRSRCATVPHLTTLHGRLDLPDLLPLYAEFGDVPLVSISDSQRAPLPGANWLATIYHGLPERLYRFNEAPGDYLAFLGRIAPEKGVDHAIRIAVGAGMKLKLAAKIEHRDYYQNVIKPLLGHREVEFLGEIDETEKQELLAGATALIFPVDWPEPFGLVMIEALACGTPAIAYRRGSVPEVIEEGRTGFIVDSMKEAVAAIQHVHTISREGCRQAFEERFTVTRMTEQYVSVYERLTSGAVNAESEAVRA